MSVKRFYWDTPSEYGHAEEHPEGELVWWTDYAKLEAENARLKAEVERLRKAANNYIDVCDKHAMFRCDEERLMAKVVALELMNAAKEGKPSV